MGHCNIHGGSVRGAWSGFSRNNRVLLKELDAGVHKFEVRAMDLAF